MRNPHAWRSLRSPFLTGLALSLAVVLLSLAALGEGTAAKPDLPTLPAVPTPAPAPTPSAPAPSRPPPGVGEGLAHASRRAASFASSRISTAPRASFTMPSP